MILKIITRNIRPYMQQFIINTIVIICVMTVYVQTGKGQTLTPEEQAWISEHPVVTAAKLVKSGAFDSVSDDTPTGISLDYLNLVASKIGLKVEYVSSPDWRKILGQIRSREIDIAYGLGKSTDREEYLNFSNPYLSLPMAYYGRDGSAPITEYTDLINKRIATVSGWSTTEIYKNIYPDLTIIEYSSAKEALLAVSTGDVDIFSGTVNFTNIIIAGNFISGLEILGEELLPEISQADQLHLAARNDWPILISILNKGMAAVSYKEFSAISNTWLNGYVEIEDIGLTLEEEIWLSQNKVIKVGVDPTVPPNETIDENGKISGIAGDYLDIIAEKLNIKFEWAGSRNWSEALEMIKKGEVDILSSAASNPARSEYLLFTENYSSIPNVIFTRSGGQIFGNVDSLSGYKVAQITDFSVTEFLRANYPDIEIIEVSTSSEAMKKVSSGEVDAHISNIPRGIAAITKDGISNIIVSGDASDYKSGNAIATRIDLPILASALQKALDTVTTVQKEEIARRWVSVQVSAAPDYKLLIQLGLIALAIITAITIWAVSAQIEIRRRRVVEKKLILSQKEAVKANAEKSTFLANMSHEIRTPLNAIIGFSDMMSSEILGKIDNLKYREYLGDINNSGHHLESVINDILDLSKIEAGKWNLDENEFDLKACINDAIKIIKLQAKDKNISLKVIGLENETLMKIYGDETAYKRIFINLLSNSVKFTGNDGVITVSASPGADGFVKIEIEDNGIGIASDKIEQVLTPFSQAHDIKSGDNIGTGLGLPIVKSLTELHGGLFSLNSEENIGTIATVLIPAYRAIGQNEKKNHKIHANQF
jgi:signal transduction histidine kinase